MRVSILIVAASLLLTACGSTEHKTVVVTPAPGSTTVVDGDGHTKVITPSN